MTAKKLLAQARISSESAGRWPDTPEGRIALFCIVQGRIPGASPRPSTESSDDHHRGEHRTLWGRWLALWRRA